LVKHGRQAWCRWALQKLHVASSIEAVHAKLNWRNPVDRGTSSWKRLGQWKLLCELNSRFLRFILYMVTELDICLPNMSVKHGILKRLCGFNSRQLPKTITVIKSKDLDSR